MIGSGSWGTTVACLAAQRHGTVLWARRPGLVEQINEDRRNDQYLPGAEIPYSLTVTNDLEAAVQGVDVLVMGVPSHGYRDVLSQAATAVPAHAAILSLSKGIEQGTLKRMTEVTREELPDHDPDIIGVLSGPNLAREVIAGQPAATVIAMTDTNRARDLQQVFMSPSFRVYTNTDVIGCEIAGALKNVMAIAAGAVDGLGFGHNTTAALITRGLAEMNRLAVKLGANPLTLAGLSGIGDLLLTCTGGLSRNRMVGQKLGRGMQLDDIFRDMRQVAEGVKTALSVHRLAEREGIEMPISEVVYRMLYEGLPAAEAVPALMSRTLKKEISP